MVKLEEVEDEAFGQTQQGPEEDGDWDTDSGTLNLPFLCGIQVVQQENRK